MSSASYECTQRDGITYVRLSGVVDEHFDAKAFLADASGRRVIINLVELRGIADGGKRLFRRTLEHLTDSAEEVLLWDASADVTEQFAETPALLALARIASYQVPYRCTSCKRDISVRLDAATLNPDDVSEALCAGCDGKLRVQRNPETLVDLRKHAAGDNVALQMKREIAALERHFAGSEFLELRTASDLPDAFETTGVVLAGLGQTRIEELTPVRMEDSTRRESGSGSAEATLPDTPDSKGLRGNAEATRANPRPARNPRQVPLQPRPSKRVSRPLAAQDSSPGRIRLEPRSSRTFSLEQRKLFAAAGGGLLLGILVAIPFCGGGGGLPEEPVLQYAISLNEGEFDEAEAVLDRSESQLPVILVELYRQEISRARAEAADVYRRQALEAYRSKRFEEAESYAAEAIAIEDPGGDMLFLLAQSLRLSGKRNDAAPHYRSFFEKYPDDEKADDAMYWRSESLARLGQYDEAKELLENIMALTRSNMKRQATKLLLELP